MMGVSSGCGLCPWSYSGKVGAYVVDCGTWETFTLTLVPWLSQWFMIVGFDSVALFLHPSKSKRRDV